MEDSERRRERLKAMRTVAAQAEASSYVEASPVPGSLANPLLENPVALPSQELSCATQRFDFYTDPMAAFTANKKRGDAGKQDAQGYFTPPSSSGSPMAQFSSPCPGLWTPDTSPSAAYHMQRNYSPNQRMHQAQGPFGSAAPYRSPRGSPFPMHQGGSDSISGSGDVAGYYSPAPPGGTTGPFPIHAGKPAFQPAWSPSVNYRQAGVAWHGNSPSFVSRYGGSSTPSGRGQGQWRGSSRTHVFGRSGGRGKGFHSCGAAPDEAVRPESFYDKSMVEDPWQHLEPVVWSGHSGSSNSWLPKSISTKKPRVSESSNKSNSQQSLAEYLAASFNEAANDASHE